jgi:hypothetical protein
MSRQKQKWRATTGQSVIYGYFSSSGKPPLVRVNELDLMYPKDSGFSPIRLDAPLIAG